MVRRRRMRRVIALALLTWAAMYGLPAGAQQHSTLNRTPKKAVTAPLKTAQAGKAGTAVRAAAVINGTTVRLRPK